MASTSTRSPVDRMLGVFADVHRSEGVPALLLSLIQPRQFARVNAVIVVAWLALAWQVGRRYEALTVERVPRKGAV